MPRKKVTNKKISDAENNNPGKSNNNLNLRLRNSYLTAFESEGQAGVKKRQIDTETLQFKVKSDLNEIALTIPASGSKTLLELQQEAQKHPLDTRHPTSSAKGVSPLRRRLQGRRRSKSQLERAARPNRAAAESSRSASRYRVNYTPANREDISSFGVVTPKVTPNIPQNVLRRPKQGELVISMQGSPHIVGSVLNEHLVNVNIPLRDGRIISIQPKRGLCRKRLPSLDVETLHQIEILRDNLNNVCAIPAMS